MSKESLHTLRLTIPGLILFVILISLLEGNQGILNININADSLLYIAVVYGFGVLFYIINPGKYIMKNSLKKIDENIKDKLIDPFTDNQDINN